MARTRAQAADAKAKADENKARVADLNQRQAAATAATDHATAQHGAGRFTRQECVDYLQAHGVYAGHSRDTVEQLRDAVRRHRYATPEPATTTADLYAEVKDVPTDNPDATAAGHPVDRVKLAKAEWKALQAWATAGRTPPRPATPNLDAVNAEHAAAKAGQPRQRTSVAKAPRAKTEVATLPEGAETGTCRTCKADLPAAKFPKAVVDGKRMPNLRADECRACRDARRSAAKGAEVAA